MAELITWSIYNSDGHYEGQASAFAPETAFLEVIALTGEGVEEVKIEDQPMDGGGHRIIYDSREFHLVPLTGQQDGTGS